MRPLNKKEILEKIEIYDVYSRYIDVSQAVQGKEGWITNVRSPFREDVNPSFTFNIHHGGWKDFAGESGDVFDLVERLEHKDFKEALTFISEHFLRNYDLPQTKKPIEQKKKAEPIKDKLLRQYTKNLLDNLYPEASQVVKKRGITDRIIKEYRIGVQRYFYKKIGLEIDEVIIPYKFNESGDAVEYKKIKYYQGNKFVLNDRVNVNLTSYTSGSAQIFPNGLLKKEQLVLVEGELDALALISLGVSSVTGTAGANTFTKSMADKLAGKTVTICYDNDTAGKQGQQKALEQLTPVTQNIFLFDWEYFENIEYGGFKVPDKYDVSEYVADGKEIKYLKQALTESKPYQNENEEIEQSQEETDKKELAEFIYENVGTEKKPRYVLVQGNLVNHICTIKRICSTRIGNTLIFYEYKNGYWNKITREAMRRYIANDLLYYFTTHRQLNDVINLLGDKTHIESETFDSFMHLVNLDNCTYDTKEMKVIPHNPDHYFTFKNIYKYDIKATAPHFMAAVKKYSLNDVQWINVMGEIFGYCLTSGYPIQKMFWWFGGGRNGKGTMMRVLEKLIGLQHVMPKLNPKGLDGQFALGDLRGKKLAHEGDMATYLPNTNILKQLTGGDRIRTDQKFKESATFFNEAKIILLMNNMLQVPPGQSLTAIFRRIVLLPFDYQISEEKENSDIEALFEKELSGIFNWAIESLKRLKKQGKFTHCERGDTIVKMHKNTVNAFMHFFDSKVIFDEKAKIWGHELFKAYSEFMDENYGKQWAFGKNFDVIVSPYSFGKEIKNQFSADFPFIKTTGEYSAERGGKATRYYGIRLMNQDDLNKLYNLEVSGVEENINW